MNDDLRSRLSRAAGPAPARPPIEHLWRRSRRRRTARRAVAGGLAAVVLVAGGAALARGVGDGAGEGDAIRVQASPTPTTASSDAGDRTLCGLLTAPRFGTSTWTGTGRAPRTASIASLLVPGVGSTSDAGRMTVLVAVDSLPDGATAAEARRWILDSLGLPGADSDTVRGPLSVEEVAAVLDPDEPVRPGELAGVELRADELLRWQLRRLPEVWDVRTVVPPSVSTEVVATVGTELATGGRADLATLVRDLRAVGGPSTDLADLFDQVVQALDAGRSPYAAQDPPRLAGIVQLVSRVTAELDGCRDPRSDGPGTTTTVPVPSTVGRAIRPGDGRGEP